MPDRLRYWYNGVAQDGRTWGWREIAGHETFMDSLRSLNYWVEVRHSIPPELRDCRLAITINDARPEDAVAAWRDVQLDPPPDGERVEVFAEGWASIAHGVCIGGAWDVWFGGPSIEHLRPGVWRPLPMAKRTGGKS